MLRGCIVMLVVLLGGYYVEKHFLTLLGLKHVEMLAGVLAVILAMMAGSVDGTYLTHSRNLGADGTSEAYEEGKVVRISGQLRLLTPAVVSPLTNRGVAIYSYLLRSATRRSSEHLEAANLLRGVGMAACEVVTKNGAVRLEGFPDLQHFREETIDAGPSLAAMAKRLTTKPWTLRTGSKAEDYSFAQVKFGLDGGVEDFLNQSANEDLRPAEGLAEVTKRLGRYQWSANETVVVPGATVTVQGTYQANPPRLKIDKSLFTMDHEMRPGDGVEVVKSEVQTQWIGMVVFLIGGLAVHVFVYAAEGRFYKALLAWLGSLE